MQAIPMCINIKTELIVFGKIKREPKTHFSMWLRKCLYVFGRARAFNAYQKCFTEIRCYLCLKWKRMERNNEREKEQKRKDTRRFRQFNKQFCLICYCVHILSECFSIRAVTRWKKEILSMSESWREGERERQAMKMIGEAFQTAKTNIYIYHFNLPSKCMWNIYHTLAIGKCFSNTSF